jgi:hypothetical protein
LRTTTSKRHESLPPPPPFELLRAAVCLCLIPNSGMNHGGNSHKRANIHHHTHGKEGEREGHKQNEERRCPHTLRVTKTSVVGTGEYNSGVRKTSVTDCISCFTLCTSGFFNRSECNMKVLDGNKKKRENKTKSQDKDRHTKDPNQKENRAV